MKKTTLTRLQAVLLITVLGIGLLFTACEDDEKKDAKADDLKELATVAGTDGESSAEADTKADTANLSDYDKFCGALAGYTGIELPKDEGATVSDWGVMDATTGEGWAEGEAVCYGSFVPSSDGWWDDAATAITAVMGEPVQQESTESGSFGVWSVSQNDAGTLVNELMMDLHGESGTVSIKYHQNLSME